MWFSFKITWPEKFIEKAFLFVVFITKAKVMAKADALLIIVSA